MSENRIAVEVSGRPQRMDVTVGGSTGDMEAVQQLLQAAARALARMGRWDEARAVARTLPAGSEAEAALDLDADAPILMFGIPVGPEGKQGPPGEAGGINLYTVEAEVSPEGWTQNADELYEKTVEVSGVKDGDTVRVSAQGVLILAATMADTEHLTLTALDPPEAAFTAVLTISRNGGGITSTTVEAAERLATPRAIELRGDALGQAAFDGTSDAVIYTSVEALNNTELEDMLR